MKNVCARVTTIMPADHYSTLQIRYNASQEEVRASFRRMAKRFHPDKNPGREKEASLHFRLILEAYETLSDVRKRRIYDNSLTIQKAQTRIRPKPSKAKSKMTSEAQSILNALLNDEPERAVSIYERLIRKDSKFNFEAHMSYADSMDCEFLLAEAYQHKKEYARAAFIYENLIEKERKQPHFRIFIEEVKFQLKKIYVHNIAKSRYAEESVTYFQKLLNLGISKREVAWAYKKLAEAYYKMNDLSNALKTLEMAFKLNPKLAGTKKICQKLGYTG